MKFHPRWVVTALFVAASGASSVSHAALVDRGGGLIYDTALNITWLANADLAATNTFGLVFGADGSMNWTTAQSWIGAMNTNNYLGYSDWRLPTTLQPDATCSSQSGGSSGAYCTGSEMGQLFYNELGGVPGQNISTIHNNANYNLFTNVQDSFYWSGTEYAPDTTYAWYFNMGNGDQGVDNKLNGDYVWAVRPGDVAAVPIPAAVWLFGSGLLGLLGVTRRQKTSA